MDVLLNSNASSALSSVLKGAETEKNPFQYRYAQDLQGCSLSGISRTMQTIIASNTVAYSSAVDFQIPKAGLLRGLIVKVEETFTGTAAGSGATAPAGTGMSIVERLELISQGRVIHSQTRESLSCVVSSQPIGSRENLSSMMNLGAYTAGTLGSGAKATFTTRIPALFSCFEALQNVYDTNFVGPLTLRVHMASDPFTPTTVTRKLNCSVTGEFIRESAEHQQRRLEADYGDGNLQKLMWNTEHHESEEQTIGTGGKSFEIKTNNYIAELWVYVDQTSGSSLQGVEMATIKLEANGQTIFEQDAQLLLQYQPSADGHPYGEACSGVETSFMGDAIKKRYRYSLSLSDDTRRALGGASARELSNFKVTVTPAAEKTGAKIHVVTKFYQIVSIEAANGKITTSISS